MAESYCYVRFFEKINGRLDENYNNPKYDEINQLLRTSKSGFEDLGNPRYLVNIVSGKTPKGIKYLQEGVPFLGSGQILFGSIDVASAPLIAKEIHEGALASSKIKKNNVLISMAGTIGHSAAYLSDDECNANQAVAILELNDTEVNAEFLMHYLNSKLGQLFFGKLQHISSQPNINLEEIQRIKVVIPDKATQVEIVEKVRVIESQALKLEEIAERTKKEAESSILTELDIPISKDESDNYFFKTGAEKRSIWFPIFQEQMRDRLSYLFYHIKQTSLDLLRKRVAIEKLEVACMEPIRRGKQPEYIENGEVAVIKTINLKNSYIDYDGCLKVSKQFYDSVPQAQVKKGDILLATTGYGSLGKIDVYENDEPAIAAVDLAIIRLNAKYDPYFVTYFLRSHLGCIQFEKWFSGSSGQIHIYEQDLNEFIIPQSSPNGIPFAKQGEIAQKITKKLTDTSQLRKKSEDMWNEARTLFEKLILT